MRLMPCEKRLYAITAGIAANSPIAVANSASAMPGATTASEVFCACAMPVKLRMIPHTVPNSPTNGATEPTVARMFNRSDSWSISLATAAPIAVASRSRVPPRSTCPPTVERRHSATPAVNTRAIGRSLSLCSRWNASISSAFQKSRSNAAVLRRVAPSRKKKPRITAQVHTLAANSPIITVFTTQSAWRNSAIGDSVVASVLSMISFTWRYPLIPSRVRPSLGQTPRSIPSAGAAAGPLSRPRPR